MEYVLETKFEVVFYSAPGVYCALTRNLFWSTEPNIAAELSSSDYANNRDPVMDAIRHYESANK